MTEFFRRPDIQVVLLTAFLGILAWAFQRLFRWWKKKPVVLEIELPNPEHIDLRLFRWVLQLKVKNPHPTKTVRNVKAWLKRIELPPGQNTPLQLKQINFPISLPESGDTDNTRTYEIAPKPFEKTFDVFMIGGDYPAYRTIGIAPFEPPFQKKPNLTQECVIAKASAGSFNHPVERYSETKSKIAEFKAMNSGGPDGRFVITVQVTGDDIKTIEKKAVLVVPASYLPGKLQYNPPYWNHDNS
jgi:hypothetical protein